MTREMVYTTFHGHLYAITVETDQEPDPVTAHAHVVGTVVDVEEIGPDHEQHPVPERNGSWH